MQANIFYGFSRIFFLFLLCCAESQTKRKKALNITLIGQLTGSAVEELVFRLEVKGILAFVFFLVLRSVKIAKVHFGLTVLSFAAIVGGHVTVDSWITKFKNISVVLGLAST